MKRFFKFCVVGGLGALSNLLIFMALNLIGINYIISATISFILSSTLTFVLNSSWTFKDRGYKCTKILWLKFMLVSTISLILNLITLQLSETFLMPQLLKNIDVFIVLTNIKEILEVSNIKDITVLYSQCLGICVATMSNFFGNNHFTYKTKI